MANHSGLTWTRAFGITCLIALGIMFLWLAAEAFMDYVILHPGVR